MDISRCLTDGISVIFSDPRFHPSQGSVSVQDDWKDGGVNTQAPARHRKNGACFSTIRPPSPEKELVLSGLLILTKNQKIQDKRRLQ